MKNKIKKIIIVFIGIICIGCTKYDEVDNLSNYVKIDVKNYGDIIIELYPDEAPITVDNFKQLVNDKFYDGLTFHRVSPRFVIQTGDPTATGSGGSNKNIKGEFANNGVENNLSHKRGIVSMARVGGNPETEETYNSASSQFFITISDSSFLDGNYAAFGEVIKGMEVVDRIGAVDVDNYEKPLKDITINSIKFVEKAE